MPATASPISLSVFQYEAKTFVIPVYAAGVPVDMTGLTLRFVVYDNNTPPAGLFKSQSIAITGDDNEIANVASTGADSVLGVGHYSWALWDVTGGADDVLAFGPLTIRPALKDLA